MTRLGRRTEAGAAKCVVPDEDAAARPRVDDVLDLHSAQVRCSTRRAGRSRSGVVEALRQRNAVVHLLHGCGWQRQRPQRRAAGECAHALRAAPWVTPQLPTLMFETVSIMTIWLWPHRRSFMSAAGTPMAFCSRCLTTLGRSPSSTSTCAAPAARQVWVERGPRRALGGAQQHAPKRRLRCGAASPASRSSSRRRAPAPQPEAACCPPAAAGRASARRPGCGRRAQGERPPARRRRRAP